MRTTEVACKAGFVTGSDLVFFAVRIFPDFPGFFRIFAWALGVSFGVYSAPVPTPLQYGFSCDQV